MAKLALDDPVAAEDTVDLQALEAAEPAAEENDGRKADHVADQMPC
jgi:hypothetical protein